MRVIFLEAGIVSLLAGVFGYALGIAGAAAGVHLIGGGDIAGVHLDPNLAVGAVAAAVAIGLMASAYPALMASRMDPNDALKAL